MTIIAAFVTDQYALLGADLLLSMPPPVATFKPPFVSWAGDARIEALAPRPLHLRQKLVLLSEKIAVSYSGNQDQAEHVIERAQKESVSPSDINDFIAYYCKLHPDLSFMVLAVHPTGHSEGTHRFTCGAWNARYVNLQNAKVKAAGTGADLFIAIFKSGALLGNDRSDQTRFYGAMASIAGYEFVGGNTLENWIGGPYEVAGLAQKGKDAVIIKDDKILHLLWHLDLDAQERMLHRIGFRIFQFYVSGDLVIVMSETKKDATERTSSQLVPGLFSQDAGLSATSLMIMDYEDVPSKIYSHILLHRSRRQIRIVSRGEIGNDVTKKARVKLERGRFSLDLDLGLLGALPVRSGRQSRI